MARRFIRFKELKERGVFNDRMDAARKIDAGFPPPYEMSPNVLAWDDEEVEQWLASRPRRTPKTGAKKPMLAADTANVEA
jgi:predicted DNA-binding transcriptional regulator AlpA